MGWWVLGVAVMASVLAARWLASGRWRRSDDVQRHRVPAWTLPPVVLAAGLLASPFFAGRPLLVSLTYALALVWGTTLLVIDLQVRRLPNRLTVPAYGVALVLLLGCSLVVGDLTALWRAAASAGVSFLVYQVIVSVSPGGEGLGDGDATLAGVLGLLLGWLGTWNAVFGVLLAFILGGVVAGVLLLVRRAGRRSAIAFGPAMIVAAYVCCVLPLSA